MAQLLSSFGKKGTELGLSTLVADIEDTSHLSKYFVISEFNPVFTGGKNPVSFNGSSFLKQGSEIKVECLDSNGNSLYIEDPKSNVTYADVAKFIISVNIYEETYNGPGKLVFVGTTKKGEIVRWIGNIAIDKTLQNSSKVRFYNKPTMESRGLLYPVISNDIATSLTKTINFTGSFYSLPVNPKRDVNRKTLNSKKTDTDYRIVLNDNNVGTALYPTTSFNSQMEGQSISITAQTIQLPFSYIDKEVNVTASFKIKGVKDSNTLQTTEPFFYTIGKDEFVTNINRGIFTSSYTWVAYNTASDAYQPFIRESYAEIVYRNIRPFSGFVARHKLYRKSLVYPGDFQLIADEPLGASELLTDPITNNKTYALMGTFYNQKHIDKYWYVNNDIIQVTHSTIPYINSMRIGVGDSYAYDDMDGTLYAIVKADSSASFNDGRYVPYNSASYNNISGSSYNSNFISLKGGSLYALSSNIIIEKSKYVNDAKVSFYFTSSVSQIKLEKDYVSSYGLKIGEVATDDNTTTKIFPDKQVLYFTPNTDYYGTLVIVPYHCNVILSELSLKVYGDYGFSPDILVTKVPFQVHVANEPFQLKAELFDINSTLIYSDLSTIQTFDRDGASLYTFIGNTNVNPSLVTFVSGSLTISQSLFIPNISGCPPDNIRLLGYHFPTHFPPRIDLSDGEVCFTNITNLSNVGPLSGKSDYINLSTINGTTTTIGRSIAVKYTGSLTDGGPWGRRISIDTSGNKTIYS